MSMAAGQRKDGAAPEAEFAALFSAVRARLPGAAWIQTLRAEALSEFMRQGLPTKRIERWKYTDFAGRFGGAMALAQGDGAPVADPFDGLKAHRVRIVDGRVVVKPEPDELPDGVEILGLAETLDSPALWLKSWLRPDAPALEALNLAFMTDGVLIRVAANTRVTLPVLIHTRLNEAGVMSHTRVIVMMERGAELTLVEVDDGAPSVRSFGNGVTLVSLDANARLNHLRLSAVQGEALVVHSDRAEIGRSARYELLAFASGPALARTDARLALVEPGASVEIGAAYVAAGEELADFTVTIDHEAPHTTSRMLVKGVAGGRGHGVVQGAVNVRPGAQKADSHQLSRAILLSRHAEIDQKPELEILADDVKCGHGAAIGALDAEQLFYLRSRGVPEAEARALLIKAFMGEVVERLHAGDWQARIATWLDARLAQVTAETGEAP